MSKYINADNLIHAIEHELWNWETVDGIKSSTVLKQTISDIKNMPSADVVEVVRCKDCEYYNSSLNCPFIKNRFVYDNDFCSYGERKETNG